MTASETVAVPDEVKEALAKVAAKEGFEKPRFHIESGSNAGDGYLSVLYRVTIQNQDDAASTKGRSKLHLMCKTKMSATADSILINHIFKVETIVYNTVMPLFEEIAHLKDPLPWPRGYPSPSIVMEDLRPEGFVMATRGMVLDEHHCRQVLTQLARWHGAGMALRHLRPSEFDALTSSMTADMTIIDAMKAHFKAFLMAGENAADMLTDRFPEGTPVHSKVNKLCKSFATDYFDLISPDPEGYNTIVHGDCHITNVMFKYDKESSKCIESRLIDFQGVRLGYAPVDIVILLLTYTEKSMRDEHWDTLMRGYHTLLQDTLREAGCKDPDAIYSWERFQVQMRRACVIGMCVAPTMIHGFSDADAIKEIQETVTRMANLENATGGEGIEAVQPGLTIKVTPMIKRRFGDVVQTLLDLGWLL